MITYLLFNNLGVFNSHTTDLNFLQSLTLPLGWLFIPAPPVWDQYTTYINGVFTNNLPPVKPPK